MNKTEFVDYIYSSNAEGSNKAASYVKALDWLSAMLAEKPFSFSDCVDIWNVNSADRIQELYEFARGGNQ